MRTRFDAGAADVDERNDALAVGARFDARCALVRGERNELEEAVEALWRHVDASVGRQRRGADAKHRLLENERSQKVS